MLKTKEQRVDDIIDTIEGRMEQAIEIFLFRLEKIGVDNFHYRDFYGRKFIWEISACKREKINEEIN